MPAKHTARRICRRPASRRSMPPWRSRWRPVFCGVGVLAGFVALLSPIDTGGDLYLFSLHMVQHLLLMMVAPPLVLLGIAGMHTPPNQFRRVRRIWWVLTRPWVALVL